MSVDKVLLLSPNARIPLYSDGVPAQRKHCPPPLGLAYIAASLQKNGYEVEVLDSLAEGYNNERRIDDAIIYGLDDEEILKSVRKAKADIIGISVMYTYIMPDVVDLCRLLKTEMPDTQIVLGGPHPSGAPDECMRDTNVDFVIVGEGDNSFVQLLDSLNGKFPPTEVPSCYYREGSEIRSTLDSSKAIVKGEGWNYYRRQDTAIPNEIDEVPYPAWNLFPMHAYWNANARSGGGDVLRHRYAVMLSTRGCPHTCYFCTSPLLAGWKGFRRREIDEVLREIQWLVDVYGVEEVQFNDENFFVNKKRAKHLLKELAETFPDLCFQVPAGAELNEIDEETIELMAAANFSKINVAIETGDPELQEQVIDKKVRLHRVPKLVNHMKSAGIEVRGLFMIGFPNEKREQIDKTIELAKNLELDEMYISIVTPLPGTPLYDQCKRDGLLVDPSELKSMSFVNGCLKLPDTTPEELEEIRRKVWREHFELKEDRENLLVGDREKVFKSVQEYQLGTFSSYQEV